MQTRAMLWGAVIAIALSSTAAMANVVVVKSLGPSSKVYPPGKTFPETAKISLQGGDVVTLLGPSSAQTLRGPGEFDAKQVAVASSANQRGRFGSLRAAEVARNPSIWDIDVSQSGKICVHDTSKLQLWRPDTETEATIQIRSEDGSSQRLSWAAGKAIATWPSTVAVKNGASYQIEWPDTGEKSSISVVAIPKAPADIVGAAQVLIENGCIKQVDLLVESATKAK